jgi:hypothetical protein
MAGAAALVFQLEQAAIDWHLLEAKRQGRKFSKGGSRVAISLRLLDERLIFDGDRVRVHTGYSISALAHAAADHGLAGLEVFASMRGHLGAALMKSFEGEIWRLVEEIVVAGSGALKTAGNCEVWFDRWCDAQIDSGGRARNRSRDDALASRSGDSAGARYSDAGE